MPNLRVPKNFQSPYDAVSLIEFLSKSTIDGICTGAYMVSAIGNIIVAVTDRRGGLTNVPGYPGVTFKHTIGLTASKVQHPADVDPANLEADFFVSSAGITEEDIEAGKWDHGSFTLFITNGADLRMGQMIIAKGFFGQFEQAGGKYRVELKGINEALRQTIGKVTEDLCDADYGDRRCALDLAARGEVKTGTLTSVTNAYTFRDSSRTEGAEYFDNGRGMWTSGLNAGFPFHVDRWDHVNKEFRLRTAAPFLPVDGDGYTVNRGCKKRKVDCVDRSNIKNMRATPDVPTGEEFFGLPNTA
jgi:uncharacterized phage protein (TIGR02218 family)